MNLSDEYLEDTEFVQRFMLSHIRFYEGKGGGIFPLKKVNFFKGI